MDERIFFRNPEYKMSAIHRAPAYTKQGNDFFVNVAAIDTTNGDCYSEAGTALASVPELSASYAAGTLLVKDMGKTVTVSGATYRKVQAVASDADSTTFYIKVLTGTDNVCKFARMTLQA